MANYYATARSNYFRVKDVNAFKEYCDTHQLDWWMNEGLGTGALYAVTPSDDDCGCWPNYDFDSDTDFDMYKDMAQFLEEGSVAIFMEVGNEKKRYLTGFAIAVNSKGEIEMVTLNDIYKLAAQMGKEVTECEY